MVKTAPPWREDRHVFFPCISGSTVKRRRKGGGQGTWKREEEFVRSHKDKMKEGEHVLRSGMGGEID